MPFLSEMSFDVFRCLVCRRLVFFRLAGPFITRCPGVPLCFVFDRLFSKLAILKYMFVFVIKLSKERTDILCTGEHSSVSNVNCVLWRGGPEIFPVCPDVDSMC